MDLTVRVVVPDTKIPSCTTAALPLTVKLPEAIKLPDTFTDPLIFKLPVISALVVTMVWMLESSLSKYSLPSAVLMAISPGSSWAVVGTLPDTEDLFSFMFWAIEMELL
jgi:hypothetical protein